ncbi:LPS export ABC transporter permease LptF [Acetobacter sp. AN02]|uniref:LPS export ABC transporter permease LptF n=1 Tax=Acetobacter sp. AN02 TaxID=2894186 RepID=UPI00243443FC|nr:LPS export ABC transporter permease LptF [Acetobacter sp. AN02]MDG6093813.1 LPS export ABC transporter permease LptF [Acetobacter sp. AN02]
MPGSVPQRSVRSRFTFGLPTLDRYVLHQLLFALLATTGGLTALIWLTQSLRFVSLVVDRGLSLRVFLELTSMMMPSFVAVVLPITTFVVVLFVYQRLAGDRELTVMRAAGLSPWALGRPGVICASFATALTLVLNLWLVPVSYRHFRQFEFQIRNRIAAFMLQEGVFTRISDTMTVYVRERTHTGELRGIMVEDDRDPASRATILAERGAMVVVNDEPRVVLYDGSREAIDRQTGRLTVLLFTQNTLDLTSRKSDQVRYPDAAEMSLGELLSPAPGSIFERDRGKLAVEGWRRLSSPFTAFSYAMIALVAILRGVFSRHGNILRPLSAILTVVGLLALSLMLQNFASRNMSLIPLVMVVAVLPGLIAAVILFRPDSGRAPPFRRDS